ncbi:MAG: ATP-binding protein [Cyanobacteria bacterium]|nr:ATP-binding protein [Cyanobacteriota bacterium]
MVFLRLSGILPTLEDRISYATAKKITTTEFLEMIFYDELERRQTKLLNSKMKKAGVDSELGVYDWETSTVYDREIVKGLFCLDFIASHHSVLVFGPAGVGKTFLARHLAFSALKAGHSVIFCRQDKMFKHLRLSALDGTRERTLGSYIRTELLIVDDFAIKEMTREESDYFYEITMERYDKKSTILTSARSPEEWQALFPDPIIGNSILDRLCHSSYQVLMEGSSLREQNKPYKKYSSLKKN